MSAGEDLILQTLDIFRISHLDRLERLIQRGISRNPDNGKPLRILDLGAGAGKYWNQGRLGLLVRGRKIDVTLLDAAPDSATSNRVGVRRRVGMLPAALNEIGDNEYDVVNAFDLLEHLSKEDGYRLLYEIDRVADFGSLIFTPNGFVWQPPSKNNPFNAHISGWKPRELKNLGWNKIRGHPGLKLLFGPYGYGLARDTIFGKPLRAFGLVTGLIVYFMPTFAFSFSAISLRKQVRVDEQDFS